MKYVGECCNYGGQGVPNKTTIKKATYAVKILKASGIIPQNTNLQIKSTDGNRTFQITPN